MTQGSLCSRLQAVAVIGQWTPTCHDTGQSVVDYWLSLYRTPYLCTEKSVVFCRHLTTTVPSTNAMNTLPVLTQGSLCCRLPSVTILGQWPPYLQWHRAVSVVRVVSFHGCLSPWTLADAEVELGVTHAAWDTKHTASVTQRNKPAHNPHSRWSKHPIHNFTHRSGVVKRLRHRRNQEAAGSNPPLK